MADAAILPASIEVSVTGALTKAELPGLFPAATDVYVTDIGVDALDDMVAAARRLSDLGYRPCPHIPARRIESVAALDERLGRFVNEAGVENLLVMAGEADRQAGPLSSSMDVLRTGLLGRHGIRRVGVAGHPEGNRGNSPEAEHEILREKAVFAREAGLDMRVVTQFGFDADAFGAWANGLSSHGIDLPVHIGVAGPAKITTLLKYAATCGVGPSLGFLKRRSGVLAALATTYSPDDVAEPIERYAAMPGSPIERLHLFPFGGLEKASAWLETRGSWPSSVAASRTLYAAV